MNAVAIIPARMGSSRFHGKPLAPICGISLLEHVYRRTALCRSLSRVVIATCDREIVDAARGFGAEAIMTSSAHERASDRTAEVAAAVQADVFVMVQGDEPMIVPEMIDLVLQPMADPAVVCANLAAPITTEDELLDPNTIKVVKARNGDALYFSRLPIPGRPSHAATRPPQFKQVCVIPFRREFLLTFAALPPTALEVAESIDMLRALEHGYRVRLVESPYVTYAVDTPEDAARVAQLMPADPLFAAYAAGRAS